ncbi:MAG: hypothetical protein KA319_00730 [Ferruginibacter sp.]|nr:hypothetical protein [Ferruginibacter sp.]
MCNIKRIVFILLLIPSFLKAQDITGLWRGTLHNDTTGNDLRYELAISQEGKKLTGYSYTFFIIEDKVYQGLKKIKIKKVDDKYIIEDDELVTHNYPVAPPKGTKQINALSLSIEDSIMRLSGLFKTKRTKEYSSLTGYIDVQRKNDFYKQSALIPHLQELGLANDLSFVKEEQEKINALAAIQNNKVEAIKNELPKEASIASITTKQLPQVEITTPQDAAAITKTQNTKAEKEIAAIKQTAQPQIAANNKQQVVIQPFETINSNTPAANLANRKIEIIQSVYFASDSLDITLYDNGEVDGDTVSVIMNGQVIMPKVGLSTNAVRKKISTANVGDSIQLIMYAETLGSLPPNTGLLIVYDGKERYEIRFSGDMQKSSAIVFRRKQ